MPKITSRSTVGNPQVKALAQTLDTAQAFVEALICKYAGNAALGLAHDPLVMELTDLRNHLHRRRMKAKLLVLASLLAVSAAHAVVPDCVVIDSWQKAVEDRESTVKDTYLTALAAVPASALASCKQQAEALKTEREALVTAQQEREEAQRAEWREIDRRRGERLAKPGVRVGMTPKQVIEGSNWGKPSDINRTTTARGVHEQWVYADGGYLYFDSGRLTAIQN